MEKASSFPKNLERWDIDSYEWKRAEGRRMEQSKGMEYGRRRQTL